MAHRSSSVARCRSKTEKKGHLRAYLLINSLTCLQWNPRNPKIKAPLLFIRTQDSLSVAIKNNKAWRQWEDSASVENSASNLIISSFHWPGKSEKLSYQMLGPHQPASQRASSSALKACEILLLRPPQREYSKLCVFRYFSFYNHHVDVSLTQTRTDRG
jgi:hypothetical protein